MSKRKQPYLPLYVQDFLTDEKLNECSAASTGVYIKLMCLMHKSESYGNILLRQKYQQIEILPRQMPQHLPQHLPQYLPEVCRRFAAQLDKHLPFSVDVITESLVELITEGVLNLEGNTLSQKRMVKDNELSIKRSLAGKKGAKKTNSRFAAANAAANDAASAAANSAANVPANTENDVDNKNVLISPSLLGSSNKEVGTKKNGSVVPPKKEEEKKEPPSSPSPTAACAATMHAEYRKQFLQDKKFLDELMLTTGIKRLHIDQWLNLFHLNLSAESDKEKPNYAEYKRHFRNWVFKQDYKNVPRGYVDPQKNNPTMEDMLREFDEE